MSADNYSYKNLKEYSETSIGDGAKGIKIMINETLRIALATDGLAIKDIPANLTEERLVAKIKALHASMQRDFRISNPRIAVLALNPKADGTEENTIIIPAVKRSEEEGINAYGPYAADEFFGHSLYEAFDCVLAMYDDQANIPFTTLMQNDGICYIASLPLVCTAPALSPDFVNAGTGEYDESALRHAIFTAIDIVRNRDEHDLPLANPLQKLYHEKRDDSEKVRFSIPKKREPFNRNEHNDRRPSQRPAQADNKNGGAPQKPDANKQQTAE